MIYHCRETDIDRIFGIVNEAAGAYEGKIPTDYYHIPYMTMEELLGEFGRINFYGWKEDGELVGVMGIETIKEVTLIRHAYVLPLYQRRGIASQLLDYLKEMVESPHLLVGTWVNATWAIKFYVEHGFTLLPDKDRLLRKYWNIPKRQIEASVVLGIGVG